MAAIETTRAQYSTGIIDRIGHSLASIAGTLLAWNDARATRNALSQLTDRELEDIGLCRGDIAYVTETR